VLTHLGDVHHADGDAQKARDAWDGALTILEDTNDPGAAAVRARLSGLAAGQGVTQAGISPSR
jgi:hypothetical protein